MNSRSDWLARLLAAAGIVLALGALWGVQQITPAVSLPDGGASAQAVDVPQYRFPLKIAANYNGGPAFTVDNSGSGALFRVAQDGTPYLTVGNSGGATITGTVTVDSGEIGATEIADTERGINLPLRSFIECETNAGADLDFSSGADAFADFVGLATDGQGFSITFDATGGSVDSAEICANLVVPQDYSSGGALRLVISKDGETGANDEFINSQVSVDAASLGDAYATELTTSTLTVYTITPTATYAAGDAVGVMLNITSTGTVDDAVLLHGVEWYYTATN